MKVNIKLLSDDAKLPTRGTTGSGGLDLYLPMDIELSSPKHKIPLGIAIEIPFGYVGLILDRSSMANRGIFLTGGVIDSDYRGEISVILNIHSMMANQMSIKLNKHDRIAQLVIVPFYDSEVVQVDEISSTERGSGGFGHTGR